MAVFAIVKDGIVDNTIVCDSKFAAEIFFPEFDVVEINSDTGPASIGYSFENGDFVSPRPFDSWEWNSALKVWENPIPYPLDGKPYVWDEDSTSWLEVSLTEV